MFVFSYLPCWRRPFCVCWTFNSNALLIFLTLRLISSCSPVELTVRSAAGLKELVQGWCKSWCRSGARAGAGVVQELVQEWCKSWCRSGEVAELVAGEVPARVAGEVFGAGAVVELFQVAGAGTVPVGGAGAGTVAGAGAGAGACAVAGEAV
jgi:hypothetical protein